MGEHELTETLLLRERSFLSPEDAGRAAEHLRWCPECQRLRESADESLSFLSSAPMKAPVPGFTARWQALKAKREAELLKNENLKLLTIIGVLMGLCSVGCALVFLVPGNFAAMAVRGASLFSLVFVMGEKLGSVFAIFRRPLTILFGALTFGIISYFVSMLIPAIVIRHQAKKEGTLIYEKNE